MNSPSSSSSSSLSSPLSSAVASPSSPASSLSSSSSSASFESPFDSPRSLFGKQFKTYVGGGIIYRCSNCRAHLALHDELVSKAFQGRHGRAFLFSNVINVTLGPKEDRLLTTGLHSVSDLHCLRCEESVGWFYEFAHNESQKYKEGKYILEKCKLIQEIGAADGQYEDDASCQLPKVSQHYQIAGYLWIIQHRLNVHESEEHFAWVFLLALFFVALLLWRYYLTCFLFSVSPNKLDLMLRFLPSLTWKASLCSGVSIAPGNCSYAWTNMAIKPFMSKYKQKKS